MSREKRTWELPKEWLAVWRISPNLQPREKFRRKNFVKFMEQVNEGKRGECLAFYRQWNKEEQMIRFLMDHRN